MTGGSVISAWADKVENVLAYDVTLTIRVLADTPGEAIAATVSHIEDNS